MGSAYLGLAVLAYLPVLIHGRFLCDDFILLSRIKAGIGIWDYNGSDFYRPAVSTVLSLLWRGFGNNPVPYYFASVLMLVGTGLAIHGTWFAIRRRHKEAFVIGLIFVLWITHSETVSWISGMTDGISVFFASIALLAFVRYRLMPTVFGFATVLLFLWLGLLGKEAIVTWMPILLALGFAFDPKSGSLLLKEGVTLAALTLVFIAWRTHVIGKLIAGYGSAAHLALSWGDLSVKFSRHMGNAFLPFNKWVSLWCGSNVSVVFTAVSCVGILALLIRKWPKEAPTSRSIQMIWTIMSIFGLLRLAEQAIPPQNFSYYGARLTVSCVVILSLVGFNLVRYGHKIALDTRWGFGAVSSLVFVLYCLTRSSIEGLFLLGVYLWFTFETRPVGERSKSDLQLIRIGLAMIAATLLAILPMLTLPVEINGEGSRFSYGPSMFATFAVASVALLYVKSLPRLDVFAGTALTASFALLFTNNIPWAQASDLSLATTNVIKSLLPARRVYVLSVPGSTSAAYLFRIGLEHLAEVSLGDTKVQVHAAEYQIRTIKGDDLRVHRFNDTTYGLEVYNDEQPKRFEDSYLQNADPDMTEGWFTFPYNSKLVDHNVELPKLRLIRLLGFDPATDHVIVVDGTSARVIQ